MNGIDPGQRRYQPASPLDRFAGRFFDSLVTMAIIVTGFLFDTATRSYLGTPIVLAVCLLHFLFSDGLPGRWSLGRIIAGTRVVDQDTYHPCGLAQSLTRNLTLLVLWPVEWLFISGERGQRLGDRWAHTLVIGSREIPGAALDPDDAWICPKCQTANSKWVFTCKDCGEKAG